MSSGSAAVRVGFLGAGSWALQNHLPALRWIREHRKDVVVPVFAALCERDPVVARKVASEYGFQRTWASVDELARDPGIDCFAIVVRPAALEEVLSTLVDRGLPIMTEKPPGLDGETAARLARLVRVPNLVAFNRRYFPIHDRFSEILASVDGPYYVRAAMFRNERYDGTPRGGPEPFVTGTGVHLINLLEYFFGPIATARPATLVVSANGTRAWVVDLVFERGFPGRLDILPCTGSHSERIEVHSRSASVYLHGCQYGTLEPPGWIVVERDGKSSERWDGDPSLEPVLAAGFVGEYLDFFNAVLGGGATRSTFMSSVATMRIAEAIESGGVYRAGEGER